jgi:mono/diheme cytochrome c family protein
VKRICKIALLPAALLLTLLVSQAQTTAPRVTPTTPQAAAATNTPQAVLTQYCITCHSDKAKTGQLTLESLDVAKVGTSPETWEKVVRKVRSGMMPPSGAKRPERAVLDAFATELETRLDRAAGLTPNPGAPALHRLNRTEYANAIRDLLNLDVDVTTMLPSDDSIEGFDNIADALGASPTLIQGYVSAALKISRLAVGDRTLAPNQVTYQGPTGLNQDHHFEGLPLGTRGGMVVTHTFPLDAEYQIGGGGGRGGGGGTDMTIDGKPVAVGGRGGRLQITAGPHTIAVAVVDGRRAGGVDDQYADYRVDSEFAVGGGVGSITITGPFNASGAGETPSRKKVLVCKPQSAAEESGCARKIISNLARRAFRRNLIDDAEVDGLMAFYDRGRKEGDFETGIQQAVARVLIAPRFIFRMEDEPATVKDGATYRIDDMALASRLSFFLWSSMPDDELLDLAAKGKLKDPVTLDAQVRRMLKDPKSDALVKNFAGQWLYLRELSGVTPDTKEFDDNLRQAYRKETEMLFDSIVREDKALTTLLDADYTYVNERLARAYGIPGIRGDYFRKITLPADSPRRGLLGQGSFLTITSIASRTSPVNRGKWILQNLMGAPPPNPPPNVEVNLDADPKAKKPNTLRERLELHRTNQPCKGCHAIMDPIGFSLENFDLIGKWRTTDSGNPINSSGVLVDGTPVSSVADLRKAVLSRTTAFMTTTTERLMTYALGRTTDYHDMPMIRTIVRDAAKNRSTFTSLVLGIVKSPSFQTKIKKSVPSA